MRRSRGAVNYTAGMATSRIGLKNMYIYGGSVLSLLTFVISLASSGNVAAALNAVIEFYIAQLIPWPLDEVLLASTLIQLIISHFITITVGLSVATVKWRIKV
jgi:hypothetical protein